MQHNAAFHLGLNLCRGEKDLQTEEYNTKFRQLTPPAFIRVFFCSYAISAKISCTVLSFKFSDLSSSTQQVDFLNSIINLFKRSIISS